MGIRFLYFLIAPLGDSNVQLGWTNHSLNQLQHSTYSSPASMLVIVAGEKHTGSRLVSLKTAYIRWIFKADQQSFHFPLVHSLCLSPREIAFPILPLSLRLCFLFEKIEEMCEDLPEALCTTSAQLPAYASVHMSAFPITIM